MQNHFAASMGYIWRLIESNSNYNDNAISKIRAQPIEGIELTFCKSERLVGCYLSKENDTFLTNLKYNSIHAPTDCMIIDEQLEMMEVIYKKCNARNLVCNTKNIEAEKLLCYDMASSLENERDEDIDKLEKTLNKFDQLDFTFDLAHALDNSKEAAEKIIDNLGHRITEVHFSIPTTSEPHYFCHTKHSTVIETLKKVIMPDVVIVSEAVISDFSELELFKNELTYLRSI